MSSKIELRLTEVDPPAPDPHRTIYRDLFNLPNPTYLGITIRYFNYDDVILYFRITGSALGYTFGTVDLGALGSGLNAYRNLDNFGSRAKPAAELTEAIKLTLRAYTDAGYTNLKWTYERMVEVIWIDSSDPSYTVDMLNNFDDGTVQGWSAVNEDNNSAGYPQVGVAVDYVLSAPNSLKMTQHRIIGGMTTMAARLQKTITTPNKAKVYAVVETRHYSTTVHPLQVWLYYFEIRRDGTMLLSLRGPPPPPWVWDRYPGNRWIRSVIPLPKNATFSFRLAQCVGPYNGDYGYLWLDDFKIISKD